MNITLDPSVDTSRGESTLNKKDLCSLKKELWRDKLVDPWRLLNPTVRDYSYYSPSHDLYSRLDLFLVRHRDIQLVQGAEIGNITLSDHAPVTLKIKWGEEPPRRANWRLNKSLIQDPGFVERLKEEMEFFFRTNLSPEVSPLTVWVTHRVFIRGLLIKQGAYLKKKRNEDLLEVVGQIGKLELEHKQQARMKTREQLQRLRDKFASLSPTGAKEAMARSRKVFYEFGNKNSKGLARALRQQRVKTCIPQVKRSNGSRAVTSAEIADEFPL